MKRTTEERLLNVIDELTSVLKDLKSDVCRTETSSLYCEHANEVPSQCRCDANCYCKQHTCKRKYYCPDCGHDSNDHPTSQCDMVLGRSWRQLGVYDG